MKLRVALLAVCSAAALAQTGAPYAEAPPADVDKALRTRVNAFYTLLLNQEYRKAEGLVAEDTKDFYYNGAKPQIRKFEVRGIQYSEHFTRAVVTTEVTQKVILVANDGGEWTLGIPSAWKLENGEWYWYVDQSAILNPVGKSTPVAPGTGGSGGAGTPAVREIPKEIPKTADFALGKLTADKDAVALAPGEMDKVTIANGSAGQVRLMLLSQVKGVEAKLDQTELNAGEKAILSLAAGKDATGGVVYLQVIPTGEAIAVQVRMK